jgi:ABC-2 type transport system permease protein
LASTSPALARGLSPLDGVFVPTFGAFYVAITLLFPFVAIRSLGTEKQNGSLALMLQLPYQTLTLVLVKLGSVLVGWALALIPAAPALVLWSAYGGHLYVPETLTLLLGHLLYGLLIATIALFAASVTDTPSTAAIVALTFTLGAWVLDFMAAGQGVRARSLADLSPTAALKSFESGLFSLPSTLGVLIAAPTLTALTAFWPPPGRRSEAKTGLSAAAIAGALCLTLLASKARLYADVTEGRRNSCSAAQEAALQHLTLPLAVTINLAPDDPRLVDFNRSILSKLRRLVPYLTVTIADTSKSLLGPAGDDRYGLVTYHYVHQIEAPAGSGRSQEP